MRAAWALTLCATLLATVYQLNPPALLAYPGHRLLGVTYSGGAYNDNNSPPGGGVAFQIVH